MAARSGWSWPAGSRGTHGGASWRRLYNADERLRFEGRPTEECRVSMAPWPSSSPGYKSKPNRPRVYTVKLLSDAAGTENESSLASARPRTSLSWFVDNRDDHHCSSREFRPGSFPVSDDSTSGGPSPPNTTNFRGVRRSYDNIDHGEASTRGSTHQTQRRTRKLLA